MTARYPLIDVAATRGVKAEALTVESISDKVDPEELARELTDISNAIAPALSGTPAQSGFGLESVEIGLTIGAEGGLAFIAKASVEASVTLKLTRV